jgi:hypothetical protein
MSALADHFDEQARMLDLAVPTSSTEDPAVTQEAAK